MEQQIMLDVKEIFDTLKVAVYGMRGGPPSLYTLFTLPASLPDTRILPLTNTSHVLRLQSKVHTGQEQHTHTQTHARARAHTHTHTLLSLIHI